MIYTHLTAEIPREEDAFLINTYVELVYEIMTSSLVKMDLYGNVIGDNDTEET